MLPLPGLLTVTAIECVVPVPGGGDPSCLNIDNVSATNDAVAAVNELILVKLELTLLVLVLIFVALVVILVAKEEEVDPNDPDIFDAIWADPDNTPVGKEVK